MERPNAAGPSSGVGSMTPSSPFDCSGMALLEDLESDAWRDLFEELRAVQDEFSRLGPRIFSRRYRWPRSSLCRWSRVWEYPYVLHHLRAWKRRRAATLKDGVEEEPETAPRVLDLGAGTTFFPFAVAREGFQVVAADSDPVCVEGLSRAGDLLSPKPGSVTPLLSESETVPVDDASFDAIYSVSVLEHIAACEPLLLELHRVLRPGGLLLVTMDVGLDGIHDLSPERHAAIRKVFDTLFIPLYPERLSHPLKQLRSVNGPYPMTEPTGARRVARALKEVWRASLGRPKTMRPCLGCEGWVLKRRG